MIIVIISIVLTVFFTILLMTNLATASLLIPVASITIIASTFLVSYLQGKRQNKVLQKKFEELDK